MSFSSHLPTTHPAAQPHIPRTTITSEDASRKLFNGDHHSITADYYKLIYKCFLFPKCK